MSLGGQAHVTPTGLSIGPTDSDDITTRGNREYLTPALNGASHAYLPVTDKGAGLTLKAFQGKLESLTCDLID
jgi:hypothetical protein